MSAVGKDEEEEKDTVAAIVDRRQSFLADVRKQSMVRKSPETTFVPKNMTQCQVEKLKALFEKYFDVDNDGVLTERDIESLNAKFGDFTGWTEDDPKLATLLAYHRDLFQCMLLEINKDVILEEHKLGEISLASWLKMWDQMMKGALALMHLPQWVQVMPFNLFSYIDKKGEGHLTKRDLFDFYTDFMGMDDKKAKTVTDNAWTQMTGNGDFKLTLELYDMSFSNFLFGRSFYGPGLFILGTFQECWENVPFKFVIPAAGEL